MKKLLLCVTALLCIASAEAQTKKIKSKAGKSNVKKAPATKATTGKLADTTSYSALAPTTFNNRLFIADPITKALDARADGQAVRISGSGVVGMPRGSYGFKNGQFKLYNTGATTSGGITGNGTVGTGSFTGSIGTHSAVAGVNGKSPYAGTPMWGLGRTNVLGNRGDSTLRSVQNNKH